MNRTRRSFFYLATYLLFGGLLLVVAPEPGLRLLGAEGDYGEALPQLAGVLLLALGLLVVEFIRHRVEVMYAPTIGVRVLICGVLLWLFVTTGDLLFLVLLAIVGLGVALSSVAFTLDRREGRQPLRA